MFSAIANCFKISELRRRIFFTLAIIALVGIMTIIPCPGVNTEALKKTFENSGNILGLFNMFSGGALGNFAVGALGIMPYISASIVMQILTPVAPPLERLQREGEHGRQKLNQYTRWLTVVICVVQGFILAQAMLNPATLGSNQNLVLEGMPTSLFVLNTIIVMTGGSMLVMWLGEQITERGIGNGASIIITVNILGRLPSALSGLWEAFRTGTDLRGIHLILMAIAFTAITAGTVMLAVGVRKIPIKHAGRVGGRMMQAQETYLPLRVNFASVMPVIFASALLSVPPMLLNWLSSVLLRAEDRSGFWFEKADAIVFWLNSNMQYNTGFYMFCEAVLIIGFSYFWVANQFNPVRIADELQSSGGYVPGLRPGQPTAEFLDKVMTRVTFAGSIFLMILALLPSVLMREVTIFRSSQMLATFFGGTSLLIVVGVVLDTVKQIETILMNNDYAGFLNKGQLRSRHG